MEAELVVLLAVLIILALACAVVDYARKEAFPMLMWLYVAVTLAAFLGWFLTPQIALHRIGVP